MIDRKELVEKMLGAYWQDCRPCKRCEEGQSTGMEAALSVAVDELLKDLDDDERDMAYVSSGLSGCQELVMRRRAQLERVKTPEERVTIFDNDKHLGETFNPLWIVQVDGDGVVHMDKKCFSREDAEIYRLGLIQQLKGSA